MRPPALVRILMPTVIGVALGLLVAMNAPSGASHTMDTAFTVIHIPAILLARVWLDAGLPPHGEGSLAVADYAVVAQWCLIGICAAALWYRLGRRHEKKGN